MGRKRSSVARDSAPEGRPEIRKLLVTWGEETHQPIQYNGFRVGPIHVEVEVGPDEDPIEVFERTMAELDAMARIEFQQKLAGFTERRKEAKVYVRKHLGGE